MVMSDVKRGGHHTELHKTSTWGLLGHDTIMDLWNIGTLPQNYMLLQPRRSWLETSVLWKLSKLYKTCPVCLKGKEIMDTLPFLFY